jgi:peroxiredoxin
MRLRNGDRFPTITAPSIEGGEMTIPQELEGRWAVLLFYRGHWCPYCRQQLLDFQRATPQFDEIGAKIVALSVDPLEQAQQTVERHRLSFPVLYGLDAQQMEQTIGAYISTDPLYLQATNFVIRPDGTIAMAIYSSGALGRLVAADAVNYVKYLQKA